jgi:hypothetical protein
VVPRGGIFLDEWRSSFAGNSDGKMNVQSVRLEHPVDVNTVQRDSIYIYLLPLHISVS